MCDNEISKHRGGGSRHSAVHEVIIDHYPCIARVRMFPFVEKRRKRNGAPSAAAAAVAVVFCFFKLCIIATIELRMRTRTVVLTEGSSAVVF